MSREKLRKYLEENNLSPHRFADICGMSHPTVINYLRGKKIMPIIAWKMYKYFKQTIPIEEFDLARPLTPYIKNKIKNSSLKSKDISNN